MGNNQATSLRYRSSNGRHIQRRNRAQVNDLDRAAILHGSLSGSQSNRHQRTVRNDSRIRTFTHHLGAKGIKGSVAKIHFALEPVAAFRLKNNDRVGALNRLTGHPVRLVRGRGGHNTQTRSVGEQRLRGLGVVLHRTNHTTIRNTDSHRHRVLLVGAVMNLRQLARDLVVGGKHEAVELNLRHGTVATQRHTDGGTDNARLAQGRIHNAAVTETCLQTLGHTVHAAELTDILTEHDDGAVGFHGVF